MTATKATGDVAATSSPPALAAAELLRRRDAEDSLLHFTKYTFPTYRPDPVHDLMASTLDRVLAGEIKRLMIFAPPQHGKSQLVSVHLPAFWLGRRPNDPLIITSYGSSLAERKSREARNLVESQEYRRIFEGVTTAQDSRAVNDWKLAYPHRGGVLAAGVGGPVTGAGALCGIIDDPHKDWKETQSLTVRNGVWEWWKGTFRTRIWEDGAVILIMTRWHSDDLAGRLLSSQADLWTVLRLPALAETQDERDEANRRVGMPLGQLDPLGRLPGEALAPGRFSRETLLEIKRDVGSLVWSAEYQGSPTALEGTVFKRDWFRTVGAAPREARRVRYWDKAGTAGGGAFTAGVLLAIDNDNRVYIEDVQRGQWSALERETTIAQTALQDAIKYGDVRWREGGAEYDIWDYGVDIWLEQEPGSSGKDSAESTLRNLIGFNARAETATGSKDVRLEPFRAQCEAKNVYLVQGPWIPAYLDELAEIPNGTYRDQSDATSGAFNKATKTTWLLA